MELKQILNEYNIEKKYALIFDVDGTLANTQPAHCMAYRLAFTLNNLFFDEDIFWEKSQFGGKVLMPALLPNHPHMIDTIVKDKQELLAYTLEKMMEPNLQLVDLIKEWHKELFIVVISNGREKSIKKILELLGITNYVDHLITSAAKPSCEAYYEVFQKYAIGPKDVIVFEDNEVGFKAAERAGISDIVEVTHYV